MRLFPCSEAPDSFFSNSDQEIQKAKQLCAECPLRARQGCLAQAIRDDEREGVWGGLTYEERKTATGTLPSGKRSEKARPCPVCGSTELTASTQPTGGQWPENYAHCQGCGFVWGITAALARGIRKKAGADV